MTALHLPLLIYPGLSIAILCGNEGPLFHQQHPKLRDRALELCESRGGRPGLPIRNIHYGLCGRKATLTNRTQELCESRGGRPRLPVRNSPYGLIIVKQHWNIASELRSCVKVEVAVLVSPSLTVFMVSVDVKQHKLNLN